MDEQGHAWEEYLNAVENRLTKRIDAVNQEIDNLQERFSTERRWFVATVGTIATIFVLWLFVQHGEIRVLDERTNALISINLAVNDLSSTVDVLLERTEAMPPKQFENFVNERFDRQGEQLSDIKQLIRDLTSKLYELERGIP